MQQVKKEHSLNMYKKKMAQIQHLPLPLAGAQFTIFCELLSISGGGLLGITEIFWVVELVPVVRMLIWLLLDNGPVYPVLTVTELLFMWRGGGDEMVGEIVD